jgi:hypothetical protein
VVKLYHYGASKYKELLTPELQGVGKEKWEDADAAAKFRGEPYPYYKHVSFLMDPAPLDILGGIFPRDHHSWGAGTKLWEHVIDPKDIDILHWRVVESPVSTFMVDNLPWLENDLYKRMYFSARKLIESMYGNNGNDLAGLLKAIDKYKGITREAYIKLPTRWDFKKLDKMYAATVPHLMIYTDRPIPIYSVKRVMVASSESMHVDVPAYLTW